MSKDTSELVRRIEGYEDAKEPYIVESIQHSADNRYMITVKVTEAKEKE